MPKHVMVSSLRAVLKDFETDFLVKIKVHFEVLKNGFILKTVGQGIFELSTKALKNRFLFFCGSDHQNFFWCGNLSLIFITEKYNCDRIKFYTILCNLFCWENT